MDYAMTRLYKYLPIDRIDVIEKLKIRMSPLLSLNDPFESVHNVDYSDALRRCSSTLIATIENDPRVKALFTRGEQHEYLKIAAQSFEHAFKKNTDPNALSRILGDRWGILSLSKNYSNLLMWAHYAENASGYVIGFDVNSRFLMRTSTDGRPIKPVAIRYSDKKPFPKVAVEESSGSIILSDADRIELLASKSKDWEYEQEERLMFTLDFVGDEAVDQKGLRIFLEPIPKDAISQIIIGPLANSDTKNRILNAVEQHSLRCDVFQARLSQKSYSFEFDKVSAMN